MFQSERADILSGIIWSDLAMAVVPSVAAQDIFCISSSAGPSPLPGQLLPELFQCFMANDTLHEAASQTVYALENGKPSSWPQLFLLEPCIEGVQTLLRRRSVRRIVCQASQTDPAAEIAQIRASGADSIFFFLPSGMGTPSYDPCEQSGMDLPIVQASFCFGRDACSAMGAAALEEITPANWSPDLEMRPTRLSSPAFRPPVIACHQSKQVRVQTPST